MIGPLTLPACGPAALALNLTPGADMAFCLGQGLRQALIDRQGSSRKITISAR